MLQYADLNTEKHGENAECRRVIGVLAFIGYGKGLFRFHLGFYRQMPCDLSDAPDSSP